MPIMRHPMHTSLLFLQRIDQLLDAYSDLATAGAQSVSIPIFTLNNYPYLLLFTCLHYLYQVLTVPAEFEPHCLYFLSITIISLNFTLCKFHPHPVGMMNHSSFEDIDKTHQPSHEHHPQRKCKPESLQ